MHDDSLFAIVKRDVKNARFIFLYSTAVRGHGCFLKMTASSGFLDPRCCSCVFVPDERARFPTTSPVWVIRNIPLPHQLLVHFINFSFSGRSPLLGRRGRLSQPGRLSEGQVVPGAPLYQGTFAFSVCITIHQQIQKPLRAKQYFLDICAVGIVGHGISCKHF